MRQVRAQDVKQMLHTLQVQWTGIKAEVVYRTDFISPRKNIVFALRGDCVHEKYLCILGVRDLKTGIFGVFWSLSGKNPCAGLV